MNQNDFLRSLIQDLTDVLYEEHGTGAQYRTTMVGNDFFEKKYGDSLEKGSIEETLLAVIEALKREQIISDGTFERDDYILTLEMRGCVLFETDKQLRSLHGKIINCPCANVSMHFVDKILGKYSELVNIEILENSCRATICLMGVSLD